MLKINQINNKLKKDSDQYFMCICFKIITGTDAHKWTFGGSGRPIPASSEWRPRWRHRADVYLSLSASLSSS